MYQCNFISKKSTQTKGREVYKPVSGILLLCFVLFWTMSALLRVYVIESTDATLSQTQSLLIF